MSNVALSPQLVLASQSPRRAELLTQMGLPFTVLVTDVDETQQAGESPSAYVERLAREKAGAGYSAFVGQCDTPPATVAIGADTVVLLDNEILGKPRGLKEGRAMLARLSGRTHEVLTGVAVHSAQQALSDVVRSRVTFRSLTESEILNYWDTGEGRDKAGSYGIQGIGGILVAHMEGSFSAVMGLPVAETEALLQALQIDTWNLRGQWLKNS